MVINFRYLLEIEEGAKSTLCYSKGKEFSSIVSLQSSPTKEYFLG